MYHKYNHIVDDTCMSIKGYNLWPLILHPQKASIAIATIAYLISKPYGNIWQQLAPLTPHPTQWSPTFCCHKKTHHGRGDFFRPWPVTQLDFPGSLGVTWYQQPLSENGSRKTQPSLTKVTAAWITRCRFFLFLEEGKHGKPTNFHDGSMDKMVFVSPQHLAKSDGFSCRFEKNTIFPWESVMGKKKKTPKNITKFLRRRPEARHFQIPKVQIFRWGHNAWCSPGFSEDSGDSIPYIKFSMATNDGRHGAAGTKKTLRWPKQPKFGNFLVFQCIPTIHFQVQKLAVSFREGRTPRVSWPKMAISMKWGPKCHFWGVKCHSIL